LEKRGRNGEAVGFNFGKLYVYQKTTYKRLQGRALGRKGESSKKYMTPKKGWGNTGENHQT